MTSAERNQLVRPHLSPHDLVAEGSVLGACMISAIAIAEIREIVRPEDFYKPQHANIAMAIWSLDDRDEPADSVTVFDELRRLGLTDGVSPNDLVGFMASAPATDAGRKHAQIVAELARKRRLAGAGQEIAEAALDPTRDAGSVLSEAEDRLVAAAGETSDDRGPGSVDAVVDLALARANAAELRGGGLSGLSTGHVDLDERLRGMEPSQLVVVGARPSMGKTAFGLGIVLANARAGVPTLFCSLEMSRDEIGARLLAMEAGVSVDEQRSGRLTEAQWTRLLEARDRLATFPLVVDDRSGPTLSEIRLVAKAMRSKQGLGLLVLDYLQLVAGRSEDRREIQIRETAEGLKAIAKDLECVVVAAAQLNRGVEAREDKRPLLSDLRESGGIEQAADVVMFIYRDEYYHPASADAGTAEILNRKNRSGPTGMARLAFLPTLARFADLSFSHSGGPS
jgi:replicative DNA helicase